MRSALALGWLLAGCPHRTPPLPDEPIARPAEGISVAVYAPATGSSYGVVDDRRWIAVDNRVVVLDRIDHASPLPSLVIEPLDGAPLKIGPCTRDRIDTSSNGLEQLAAARRAPLPGETASDSSSVPRATVPAVGVLSPLVRCTVDGAPGKHFVRVLHVAPAIAFRASHKIDVTNDSATVASRYALATPPWKARAEVTLYDGVPGGEVPPRAVAHGAMLLDGGTAIIPNPNRTVTARVRRIYDGAVRDRETPQNEIAWGRESRRAVWVALELDAPDLPSGSLEVHAAIGSEAARDVVVPQLDREVLGTSLRVPLWVDEQLHGVRRNDVETVDNARGKVISQRVQLSVANAAEVPLEVIVEERLRVASKRDVHGVPNQPQIVGDLARTTLTIQPKGTERVTYTMRYEF